MILFISIKFDFEKKWIICKDFVAGMGILTFLVFSESGIEYLWQREISVCKVLVPIKRVPVKNDYFLYPEFELHRY